MAPSTVRNLPLQFNRDNRFLGLQGGAGPAAKSAHAHRVLSLKGPPPLVEFLWLPNGTRQEGVRWSDHQKKEALIGRASEGLLFPDSFF